MVNQYINIFGIRILTGRTGVTETGRTETGPKQKTEIK